MDTLISASHPPQVTHTQVGGQEAPTGASPRRASPSTRWGSPSAGQGAAALTDAGGHRRAALLVALGTAVAREAGYAILAWALPCRLVAGLAGCANGVAVASWVGKREKVT